MVSIDSKLLNTLIYKKFHTPGRNMSLKLTNGNLIKAKLIQIEKVYSHHLMSVTPNYAVNIFCYCDSVIDFLANCYFILQIYHTKS